MRQLAQSTSRVVMFKAHLATDHVTPATGKTIAVVISKNGGAFGNPNAGATNATEVSAGWYKVTLDTTDTDTIGDLIVRGTEATIDPAETVGQVVVTPAAALTAYDPPTNAEMEARTIASANYATASALQTVDDEVGAIDTVVDAIKAKTDSLTFTVAGQVDANVESINTEEIIGDGSAGTPFNSTEL